MSRSYDIAQPVADLEGGDGALASSDTVRSRRLLLVTHYYPEHRGGIEMIAGRIASEIARHDWQVTWAASDVGEVNEAGTQCKIRRFPMKAWNFTEQHLGFPYPLWGPKDLIRLWSLVGEADVVHLHDCLYFGNIASFLFAKIRRKPVVVTQHIALKHFNSRVLRMLNSMAYSIFGRMLLGGCSRVIFISAKVQSYFDQFVLFRRKPLFVPNGVSCSLFYTADSKTRRQLRESFGFAPNTFVILFVGRLAAVKNLSLLRKLAKHFEDIEWAFVGRGPDQPDKWGLPNVRYFGEVKHEEVGSFYQAADLLMLPSIGEGFPLVVQEAMACGLPTLISQDTALGSPGIEDVAYVTDLDWDRLVADIQQIVRDSSELEKLRSDVVDFAKRHWNEEACIRSYLAELDSHCGNNHRLKRFAETGS